MLYQSVHDRLTGVPNRVMLQVVGSDLLADIRARWPLGCRGDGGI
jgi:GGDEF domain-containing protein